MDFLEELEEIDYKKVFLATSCKRLNKDLISRVRICYSNNNGDALKFIDNGEILHDVAKTEAGKEFIKNQGDERFDYRFEGDGKEVPYVSNRAFICNETYFISPLTTQAPFFTKEEVEKYGDWMNTIDDRTARTPDDLILFSNATECSEMDVYSNRFSEISFDIASMINGQKQSLLDEYDAEYNEEAKIEMADLVKLQENINEALAIQFPIVKEASNKKENELNC